MGQRHDRAVGLYDKDRRNVNKLPDRLSWQDIVAILEQLCDSERVYMDDNPDFTA